MSKDALKCCYHADREKGGEKGGKSDVITCHIIEMPSELKNGGLMFLASSAISFAQWSMLVFNEVMVWGVFISSD